MRRRKYEQIKAYSKIIKYKKSTGQLQEVTLSNQPEHTQEEIVEEKPVVDFPKNQQFEDPFEDEFIQEQAWVSDSEGQEEAHQQGTMISEKKEEKRKDIKSDQVFLGTNKNLSKGQILEFDNRAYDMLHRLSIEWPALSIDFVCKDSPFDSLPRAYEQMNKYPYEVYTVQGSTNNSNKNSIYFSKFIKLYQTKYDDEPDVEDNEEGQDDEPQVITQEIETTYDVNRIRALNNSPIVAFWNDDGHQGQIHIVDLSANLQKLKNNIGTKKKQKSKEIVIPCDASGFAINWNPHKIGELATGDNNGVIKIYNNNQNYTSWTQTSRYSYHKGSVEDVIYSPEQSNVFASCSSDGTLQIVDTRVNNYKKAQIKIEAHEKDVNVCDWNKVATNLIVTGSDDCKIKVWDLKMIKGKGEDELLCLNWHTEPITSVKFQPNEESVIAVASEDNRLTIWDMSVENQQEDPQIPNELMFLHQGQQEIKQICFHPIYYEMIASTALDSINIFKPAFEMPQPAEDERADLEDLKRLPPIREEELDKYLQRMSLN